MKSQIFRSMREFEEKYFPEAFEWEKIKELEKLDARTLGVLMAKESLEEIRRILETTR